MDKIYESQEAYDLELLKQAITRGDVQLPIGPKGDSYILTDKDKQDIVSLVLKNIKLPTKETIIEKTETIHEIPLVTNEIKEVAISETGETVINKINTDDTVLIRKDKIEGLDKIEKLATESRKIVGGGSIARNFYQLFDVPQSYKGQSGKIVSVRSDENGLQFTTSSGSGTVTSVSVATANGVSGTVANPTTTPAITLVLGAITPTKVTAGGIVVMDASGINVGSLAFTVDPLGNIVGATLNLSNNFVVDSSGNVTMGPSLNIDNIVSINSSNGIAFNGGSFSVDLLGNIITTGHTTFGASTTSASSFNIPAGTAPSAPVDGDVWRENNTNTGLKIRINGVTKTISLV